MYATSETLGIDKNIYVLPKAEDNQMYLSIVHPSLALPQGSQEELTIGAKEEREQMEDFERQYMKSKKKL